ncbi:hypothetical protein Hdeb2414_s0005g00172761 [Helianthus debilis subsp. tardiflorus]
MDLMPPKNTFQTDHTANVAATGMVVIVSMSYGDEPFDVITTQKLHRFFQTEHLFLLFLLSKSNTCSYRFSHITTLFFVVFSFVLLTVPYLIDVGVVLYGTDISLYGYQMI